MGATYEIVENGQAIKCLVCTMVSWSPGDIEHLYCGNCHQYHADLARQKDEPKLRPSAGLRRQIAENPTPLRNRWITSR